MLYHSSHKIIMNNISWTITSSIHNEINKHPYCAHEAAKHIVPKIKF